MGRANRPKRGGGKRTVSIIVDGQTEVWYLQMLRDSENVGQLTIKPELAKATKFGEQFEWVKDSAEQYDTVIWILDLDTVIKESREAGSSKKTKFQELSKYLKKASDYGNVHILVNTPCLEYWFLLHDRNTAAFYDECGKVENLLIGTRILSGYEKTQKYYKNQQKNIYSRLKEYQTTAIQRAERLGEFDITEPERAISEMYRLFEILGLKELPK